MPEIRIGDKWINIPDIFFFLWLEMEKAEQIEARIWRPLDTVIGYQDFVRLK